MNEKELLAEIASTIEAMIRTTKESNDNILEMIKMTRDVLVNLDDRVRVLESVLGPRKVKDDTTH